MRGVGLLVKHYRARYYDASTVRFISEDSARFAGGSVDFYGYVENSPLNFIGPTGHVPKNPKECCQKNIDAGRKELQAVLQNAEIMGAGVFKS